VSVDIVLEGWSVGACTDAQWVPWGADGKARAKILASSDGYSLAYVEAEPGYAGNPHVHEYTEFLYVLEGTVRNQGSVADADGGYVAAAGSSHNDFGTETGARYVSIFRI
jgi:hypothetical protein